MGQFLLKHKLKMLTKGKIAPQNRPISIEEIEVIINSLPKKNCQSYSFPGGFYQTLKTHMISNIHNLFQKIEAEGMLLTHSMRPVLPILIPKWDKDITRKENYRPISITDIEVKIINKILANPIKQYIQKLYTTSKCDLLQIGKSGSIITYQCTSPYQQAEEEKSWLYQLMQKKFLKNSTPVEDLKKY